MNRLKSLSKFLPELCLLIIVLFYWYDTGIKNPVAWGLFLLLILQLILQKTIMGMVVGSIFIFLSAWMVLAFLSDAVKIENFNYKTNMFLVWGIIFCGSLMASSVFMLMKYSKRLDQKTDRLLY